MAIRAIADGLVRQAARHQPYEVAFVCNFCDATHMFDLAKEHGLSVAENRALSSDARPDILVRHASGQPAYVVEVVVTHAPEEPALETYRERNLPVIVVKPTWEAIEGLRDGLEALTPCEGLGDAGTVGLLSSCRLPRHLGEEEEGCESCSQCGSDARVLTVEVSTSPCWRRGCSRQVRVFDVHVRQYGVREMIAPSASELKGVQEIARELGVRLEHRYSKVAGTKYWMNVCECNAPLGDNYVYNGFSSNEFYELDFATPVRHYRLCRSGHWNLLFERPWTLPATAGRRVGARGLCGDWAGIFDEVEPLVRVQTFEHTDDLTRQLARFMTRGGGR